MQGWCSVEELVKCGFARARVVMANEAHETGVRRLAMEALPWPATDTPGPIRDIPPAGDGYLGQPDMRRLIAAALGLGWSLWAYEAVFTASDADPTEFRTMEFTNWREPTAGFPWGGTSARYPAPTRSSSTRR